MYTGVDTIPLGMTMLMEEGHAAAMKSRSRGLSRCRTGSSCLMDEIHMDMGRSCACFFTLRSKEGSEVNTEAGSAFTFSLCWESRTYL